MAIEFFYQGKAIKIEPEKLGLPLLASTQPHLAEQLIKDRLDHIMEQQLLKAQKYNSEPEQLKRLTAALKKQILK